MYKSAQTKTTVTMWPSNSFPRPHVFLIIDQHQLVIQQRRFDKGSRKSKPTTGTLLDQKRELMELPYGQPLVSANLPL